MHGVYEIINYSNKKLVQESEIAIQYRCMHAQPCRQTSIAPWLIMACLVHVLTVFIPVVLGFNDIHTSSLFPGDFLETHPPDGNYGSQITAKCGPQCCGIGHKR